ncbi:signal recognition particle subunit SRP72-like [Panicum miliaceum]|uniref:Signal recognition particle subunit SRP72-like n=1 Tax=Panicum miliaceum TaxID=4540 RepID=A0A3L6SMN3_PANMI|nr:signal recognition particle subunit SRP72-like [Panicum miliaceum]
MGRSQGGTGGRGRVRCKVVAHIKADKIDKALTAMRTAECLPIDFSFYKDYCYYRQNKLQEALDLLRGQEETAAILQLKSQILYRLGRMNDCMNSYEKLQKFNIDSMDLKINIIAALVAAGRAFEVQTAMKAQKVDLTTRALRDTRSFELAYNSACSLIEDKKIGKEELMVEDYGEDEIEYELAPVSAQLAYVQQAADSPPVADPSSLVVATTNLISLKGTKNATDSLKKLDRLIEKSTDPNHLQLVDFKLSQRQKEALYSARAPLLLHTNKTDQAHELVSGLLGMFQDSVFPVLLQAAVHVKEKKVQKAEEVLSQYAEKHPENSKGVLLALAQIAANANHFQLAADSLSKIPDIQHMPATVATLGRLLSLSSVMDVMKRLVCSRTNLEKAEQYEKKLKPLPGLKGVNVESLEKTSGARHVEGPQDMKGSKRTGSEDPKVIENEAECIVSRSPTSSRRFKWNKDRTKFLTDYLMQQASDAKGKEALFREDTLREAAEAVSQRFQRKCGVADVQRRLKALGEKWKRIQKMKALGSVSWDHATRTISMREEDYQQYAMDHPNDSGMLNRPIEDYDELSFIFSDEYGPSADGIQLKKVQNAHSDDSKISEDPVEQKIAS